MQKKKRIAFFGIKYFPSRGGTSRVAENLIHNMVKDYDITIYCYRNTLATNHIKGVKVIQLPRIKLGPLGVFVYYLLCYWHIRYIENFDIVHAHKIDSFFFLKGLQKKSKVIATVHGMPYNDGVWGGIAKSFFKVNEKRFLKFSGIKTAISKPLADHYESKYGVPIEFIPNGINIVEDGSDNSIINFWPNDVPTNQPFVLFSARRIMSTKGLHTLLLAFKKNNYKGNIFVAGELDFDPTYMKKVRKIGEGLNISYLGFVNPLSTLLQLIRKCEYFIFPSEIEGMSIMLLEVASTGKSILASDIPENTQVFNGNEVLFFEDKNVDDLADKLSWIEDNKAKFEKFGAVAREKVFARYTWDRIALEYKSLYNEL